MPPEPDENFAFDVTITNIRRRTLYCGLVDQDGQEYPALPNGAEMEYESDNPSACTPLPNPGRASATLPSGTVGVAVITLTPGGTLTGEAFAPKQGRVTILNSEPAGFAPRVGDEELEEEPPPIA